MISIVSVILCYSNISDEYKTELTSESTEAEKNITCLSTNSVTETTAPTVPKTTSAANIVSQSNKSEIISDVKPLIFYYDDANYTVGNCSFSLEEIDIATQIHKGSSYLNIYRVYGTVKNNSEETTTFSIAKYNSYIIGSHYENGKEEYIKFNDVILWKSDKEKQTFRKDYTLAPGEERRFAVQAIYIGSPKTYDYALEDVVFYFCNDDKLIEISFE